MKIFPAKAQRRKGVLAFAFAPLRLCAGKLIAIGIVLSFIAVLVPIASASRDKNTMPCCVGKAGHCDSGLTEKKIPQPPSEPMCGLDNAESVDDGITIVAEPSHNESHHSHSRVAEDTSSGTAAESASLTQPCQMDCGACLSSSTRQQNRERGIVLLYAYRISSVTTLSKFENLPFAFTSNEDWEQTSPRGPPADLL
jgi:hypothetical protein